MRELVRRVGQRFMVGWEGYEASPPLKRLIRDFGVGHLILFARNVDGPEQVAEMLREAQSWAREARHDVPLLVAVDQEGGRVARLKEPWTVWPPLRAVGRADSEELAGRMGAALAAELSACGIGQDLVPVLDVDTNPKNPVIGDRSLGDDPERVGRLGAAMIRGLQDGGVAACAKHFPGHGDTDIDSHLALPAVDHPRSRLEEVELKPFRKAMEAGVGAIMTAHIVVRELDDSRPATLSPRVITDLLRKEMGYGGVVVGDDLEMKAVAERWRPGVSAVLAAKAGCDVLPVCRGPEAQEEALEAVIHAVEGGEISWAEMDDANLRIRRLKERFLLPFRDPDPKAARRAAGTSHALALEIGERGGVAV